MKYIILSYIISLAMLLAACHRGHNHEHGHDHASHDHHDHDHAGHEHEGHNHAHEEDNHGHGEHEHDHAPDDIVITPEQAKEAGIIVKEVQPVDFNMVIKVGGQIQVAQGDERTVVASSNGIVSFARLLTEGSAVRQGETLLTVSSQNMLEGDPVVKAKLAYEQAEREYRRAESLAKDTLMSRREYEQIRTNYETAKVAYDALSKSQTAKGVSVSASIGGYVKNRFVTEGEYVTAGQPLVTVSQNRRLQLRCDVPEKYGNQLPYITTANFKTPYNDAPYQLSELNGRLLSYGRSTDAATFHIPVTFEFDNKGDITSGAFVETYLISKPLGGVITVPLQAMVEEQGLYFVFVQTCEDSYKKREIKIGEDNGLNVRIISGLESGDRVVTQGAIHVKLASNATSIPEHSHSH